LVPGRWNANSTTTPMPERELLLTSPLKFANEMDENKLITFIEQSVPIPRQKVEEIAAPFQEKQINKNEFFIKQGRVCNNYFFLENGFIRSYTFDLDGNDVTTEFYSNNQIVFEAGSFFLYHKKLNLTSGLA